MTNNLTPIMYKILARALKTLRQKTIMPRLINNDYSADAAKKGDVINVPIPVPIAAIDVVPNNVAPLPADVAPKSVAITMNNWKEAPFALTDKDIQLIDKDASFLPMEMDEAIKALANAVNQDIFAQYKSVFGFVGTPGTTPFATDVTVATQLRKVLNQQLVPSDLRRAVLNFDAEANALALAPFRDVSQSSDRGLIIEGEIGRKFGIDWFADDFVPTHNAGTGTGYQLSSAGTVGDTVINIGTGSGTVVIGDIVTFAGNTQTYAVTGALAGGQISVYPALVANVSSGAAMTIKASHVVNMAFHRDAFAFAARPLAATTTDMALGNQIAVMTDPLSGIPLRLEVSREYKQTRWSLDILWGSKLVRPELAARLAG